jgi:hypothetical protein
VEFNKEQGFATVLDKSGKIRLAYSTPTVILSHNTVTLTLDWNVFTSSLSVTLLDFSFPLILAFGLGIPDTKGVFNFDSLGAALPAIAFYVSSVDDEVEPKVKPKVYVLFHYRYFHCVCYCCKLVYVVLA